MNRGKLFAGGLVAICLAALGIVLVVAPAAADLVSVVHTTLEDFNAGSLYHTGLSRRDDGEVQLLVLGLSGDWITDTNTTGLPALYGHTAEYDGNGHILVLGGMNSSSQPRREVYYTTIDPFDHDLADWQTTTALPSGTYPDGVYWHTSAVVNDYVYVIGGAYDLPYPATYADVTFAHIDTASGTLDPWQTASAPLPEALRNPQAVVIYGRIYVVGGRETTGAPNDDVYFAEPNPGTGQITSWSSTTTPFVHGTFGHMAAAHGGILYVMGGINYNLPPPYVSPYTHFAMPDPATGQITNWTQTIDMEHNLYGGAGISFSGILFTTAGCKNNINIPSDYVGTALINEQTGDILPWTDTSLIDPARFWHDTVYSGDGWIYVINGHDGSGPFSNINRGTVSGVGDRYAPEGTFISDQMDLGGQNRHLVELNWNTTITDTSIMTITMYYRRADEPNNWSGWFGPFPTDPTPGTVTTTLDLSGSAQFFQYRADFTTTVTDTSPTLNAVQLIYDIPICQVNLEKAADPPSGGLIGPGQVITYSLTYSNSVGGITMTNAYMLDSPPEFTRYLTGSISGPGADDSDPWNLRWDLGTVEPGDEGVGSYAVLVDDPIAGGFSIENAASLFSGQCNRISNSVWHTTVIEGPDFVVDEITTDPECPGPGDAVIYYVTIRNQGTRDANEEFWVELYVKERPSDPPAGPSDHDEGYCQDDCTIIRPEYVQLVPALAQGDSYVVPFNEGLTYPSGGIFDFYAQVDVAFDDPVYHPLWGRHAEENEYNNIGHIVSCGLQRMILPIVIRQGS